MAGAGFKTFTTGEVLLAADVNTYLMQQSVMVFDDAADRTSGIASPSEGMLSYLKDTNAVEKYDGSSWSGVGGGGGGKILQVVNTTLTSGNFTTSSNSFVDVTNLNVSITPATTGSRIMVFLTATCSASASSGGNVDMRFALVRTSTILTEERFDLENNTGSSTTLGLPITLHYVDSPSTTSATTYKLQVKLVNYSSTVTVQANGTNKAMLTVMEIGA